MKYLCLVYEEEAKVAALPGHELAAITDEDRDELAELQRSGNCLASARLQPAEMAATVRVRNGSLFVSDGPIVRDEGAIGWISPDRCQGPERRHPDRCEDAKGTLGLD